MSGCAFQKHEKNRRIGHHGDYKDLHNDAYQHDSAIARSGIVCYLSSPYKYWANYINPDRPVKEQTSAMMLGSAFHTLVLQPELFDHFYFILPEKVLLKEVGKIKYEEFKEIEKQAKISKKQVLSQSELHQLLTMRDVLLRNVTAKRLIEGAIYESSYFWEDEHTGLMCKSRPDILHENMIVDLKTCNDASPRAFQNDMTEYGNYIQGAMIKEGVKKLTGNDIKTVINICIEKTYPYAIGIYIIDESALEHGHMQFKNALLSIKNDIANNNFESYPMQTIGLPKWAI